MRITKTGIVFLLLIITTLQFVHTTNAGSIRSNQIIDTIEPIISIPDTVYSGEIIEITGVWEAVDNANILTDSEIKVSLYQNNALKGWLNNKTFFTSNSGTFVIYLDHTDLGIGNYRWYIEFSKAGYQGWIISQDFIVLPTSYTVQISSAPELINGEPYFFDVIVTYDNDGANNDGQAAGDVELRFTIVMMYENGGTTQIVQFATTSFGGVAILALSADQTRDLKEILSVSIEVPEGPSNNPVVVSLPPAEFPVIVTIENNDPSLFSLEFVKENLIGILAALVIIFGSSTIILYIKRRKFIVVNSAWPDNP